MFFVGVECEIRRAPNLPFIEVSAVVADFDCENKDSFYLQLAQKLIDLVQQYGGTLISPFGEVPKDKHVFFTAKFENNQKTEEFLKAWKN